MRKNCDFNWQRRMGATDRIIDAPDGLGLWNLVGRLGLDIIMVFLTAV
jgi:hypothetical protein